MFRRALVAGLGLALLGSQAAAAAPAPDRAATVTPNVNVTKLGGNQSEAAIAIDPTDPSHVVEFSNRERGAGMVLARSADGGATWDVSSFARDDRFGKACCDPTLSWDAYGNLFMSWLDLEDAGAIPVAISTNGGRTFHLLEVLRPNPPKGRRTARAGSSVDQPTIVAGQGAVWLTWNNNGIMQAAGARVSGPGQVGRFSKRQDIAKSRGCSFGDVAIGPAGQVFEVCTKDRKGTHPTTATIRAATDPDGLGPRRFSAAKAIGTTNVQQFDAIPPQRSRTVDAETGLAWDTLEGSPHAGRLYLLWTDEQPNESNDTDVWIRSSDDAGLTWSAPVRVNDVTTNAQFLPRLALDPTTGNLAVGWHDARNDLGDGGAGDTDGKANTDAMYYVTFSVDGGATFVPAVAASAGASNAKAARNGIDFGDYSGLAFYAGVAMAAWSDNSDSTGDNPGGTLRTFDIYAARVSLD
jgi:hypothetical protein